MLVMQTAAEVMEPRRKKGKPTLHQGHANAEALSPRDCVQAGHAVAQGVIAVAGDAACLLRWDCGAPAAVATFGLASALLSWANELCQGTSGRSESMCHERDCLMSLLYNQRCTQCFHQSEFTGVPFTFALFC